MARGKHGTIPQLDFALTAAREKVQQLLALFPALQAEFTSTNHTAPALTEGARAKRDYHREYYRRHRAKKPEQGKQTGKSLTATGRKKLSMAMKARWAASRATGATQLVKTAEKGKTGSRVINAAEAIQAQLKTETAKERKNRKQREWRANKKKLKGVK